MYTYSSVNSCGNLYFIWTVSEEESELALLTQSQAVVWKVEATIPTYHTHAMRKQFVHDFQLLVLMEPKVTREMYYCLTGDSSASCNLIEATVDEQIKRILQLQYPVIFNEGRPEKYQKLIEERSVVDERRHGEATHLACAMSV